jgi:cysteine desulfurase/selenocysteine lyase
MGAWVPVYGGTRPYINLDNAASTPALQVVEDAVHEFLPWYSSVHRGNGFKSRLSTHVYEQARAIAAGFVGADPQEHVVIFGKNTTEAINKLAYRLPLKRTDIVIISGGEHHSNDLPWRNRATVVRMDVTARGGTNKADFERLLERYAGRVKLVAISGASNVTGHMPDIHWFARKAHQAGAQIFVDCAQLAAHRPIHIGKLTDDGHLDYIALSGHKMYAPFGTGALIGRRDTFSHGTPEYSGGGTISVVTDKTVDWAMPPESEEAGSPNVVGAMAMARAMQTLQGIGLEAIASREAALTAYALQWLATVPGLQLYGDTNPERAATRAAVIPFTIAGVPHGLVAAALAWEWGIGVRSGCFCAQPYVMRLLGLNRAGQQRVRYDILHRHRERAPGLVRISFGLCNTTDDIDRLVEALAAIAEGTHREYTVDAATGEYRPKGAKDNFEHYFSL